MLGFFRIDAYADSLRVRFRPARPDYIGTGGSADRLGEIWNECSCNRGGLYLIQLVVGVTVLLPKPFGGIMILPILLAFFVGFTMVSYFIRKSLTTT
ncbi:MAG: hypothetical protein JRI72_09575 [Deltaproteobacteria bacterium]|nr:hypothetical protein [Deltaproteobacteria bacterium]